MSVSFLLYPGFLIKSFLFWEQQVSFVSGRLLEAVTWDKAPWVDSCGFGMSFLKAGPLFLGPRPHRDCMQSQE